MADDLRNQIERLTADLERQAASLLPLIAEWERRGKDVGELTRSMPGLTMILKFSKGEFDQITERDIQEFRASVGKPSMGTG